MDIKLTKEEVCIYHALKDGVYLKPYKHEPIYYPPNEVCFYCQQLFTVVDEHFGVSLPMELYGRSWALTKGELKYE